MATLAEGVARLIEKHIASQHSKTIDDVAISTKAIPGMVVPASRLPDSEREAIDMLLRRETNRAAFRKLYRQRVSAFRESLASMEEDVARELEALPQPEVVVGVRGRTDTQIVISRADDPADAAAPEAGAEAGVRRPKAPRTKSCLRDGMVWAAEQALTELGVRPDQPFSAPLAVQITNHPQLRPLILLALPEGMSRAAAREKELRGRNSHERGQSSEAGAGAAEDVAASVRRLTRDSRPRKKAALVKVSVKQKRS